jgi:hypothetical protein
VLNAIECVGRDTQACDTIATTDAEGIVKLLRCKLSCVGGSVTGATMSTFALLLGAVDAYGQTLRVQVRVASELENGPFSGRLVVLLSTQSDPKEELEPGAGDSMRSVWIAAEEVQNFRPGHAFEIQRIASRRSA